MCYHAPECGFLYKQYKMFVLFIPKEYKGYAEASRTQRCDETWQQSPNRLCVTVSLNTSPENFNHSFSSMCSQSPQTDGKAFRTHGD